VSAPDDTDSQESACPFCGSVDDCPHVLLVVDKTFRTAEGGVLMEVFNASWSAVFKEVAEDFDERGTFDGLLERVESLADTWIDSYNDGAPGMSSAYITFFVSSRSRAKRAVAQFGHEST
jgi:hypothetical protein